MNNKIFFTSLLFFFSLGYATAQDVLDNLSSEDSSAIAALSQFPQSVRKDMLQVCLNPELLVNLEYLQKNSVETFRKLVSNYSREEQQKIWNLTTYPGLVNKLGAGKKPTDELDKILAEYPVEISPTAKEYNTNHSELLSAMVGLNQKYSQEFETLIKEYPDKTKDALRNLIKYPEVLSILTSNMKTTVILGDAYKNKPLELGQKLDSIATEEARQNALDYEVWKSSLEKNPEAQKEMEEASQEFKNEQGNTGNSEVNEQTVVINNNYYGNFGNHYPYWFGYPYWYEYPVWYNRPYWYHTGFYRSSRGVIIIGLPTPYYAHWYFRNPQHHHHYNHFSDHWVGHYYGCRRPYYGSHREVHHWVRMNEPRVPGNFFSNDPQRPARIKELGKFEDDYNKKSINAPRDISRDEFLKENQAAYPNLTPRLSEPKPEKDKPREPVIENRNNPRQSNPPVQVPPNEQPKPQPQKPRSAEPKAEPQPQKPAKSEPRVQPQKPRTIEPRVQPKPQQTPQPAKPRVQPAPQQSPQPAQPKVQPVPNENKVQPR